MEEFIKEAVTQLLDGEGEGEAELVHQLRRLSKLATNLKKRIQEMNTNQ